MKVFLSWSGTRSRYLADALRAWLPRVIQSLKPWMSDEDIAAGSRWLNDVSTELGEAKIGILLVTPENQSNPWLVFEAGALSKTLEQPFVCPLLFDISPGQLGGPLAQFQALELDRAGVLKVLQNLNSALGQDALDARDLTESFDVWWPKLAQKLEQVPPHGQSEHIVKRSTEDILEEILNNTREQLRRENVRLEHSAERDKQMDNFLPLFENSIRQFEEQSKDKSQHLLSMLQKIGVAAPPQDLLRVIQPAPGSSMKLGDLIEVIKSLSESAKNQSSLILQEPGAQEG